MKKIGPILQIADGVKLTMQSAYDTDVESGSHNLNNAKSEMLNKYFPTVVPMAAAIEKQRDELVAALQTLKLDLENNGEVFQSDSKRIEFISEALAEVEEEK